MSSAAQDSALGVAGKNARPRICQIVRCVESRQALREALEATRKEAIDMNEIFERVTIRNHKSFPMHGAIFKVTRDICKVGDVWAFDTSSLELQNAETKRVASSTLLRLVG